ncbi:MAG: DUF4139 domain-containing protein [Magnetococcales bacterium]|nr:DUF4139 domain-containing protein [Magnetococcales bacterium]
MKKAGIGLGGSLLLCCGTVMAAEVPMRAVALFASGVGYFQHAGPVTAPDAVRLSFKEEQIDDLLKSLVVEDVDGGSALQAVYPSREPLERLLAGLQVDLSDDPGVGELLTRLRGARVSVTFQGEVLKGRITGAEQRPVVMDAKGEAGNDWVVNLAGEEGMLRSLPWREVRGLQVLDERVRQDLGRALEILDGNRGKERREVVIPIPGQGAKRVRLGYVMESPVWKSAWRLSLPAVEAKSGKSRLQGWAIVENQSGQDWKDVRLTLASGRPISFIEELSKPWYRPRQRIVDPLQLRAAQERELEMQNRGQAQRQMLRSAAPAALAKAGGGRNLMMDNEVAAEREQAWETALPDPGPEAILASGEQAGETFVFKVEGVNLERGQGAMLPIVSAPLEVERLTLFDTGMAGGGRSMRALKVVNTTGGALPPGPVTLYDGDLYAGEARFEHLSAGADQLLSYALDLDVEVVRQGGPTQRRLESVKMVKGVLELSRREKRVQRYSVRNRGKEARQVVVIQPREAGWEMVSPATRKETGRSWRLPMTVAAGAQAPLEVVEERLQSQQVALLTSNEASLSLLVAEEGMEASVRKGLEGLLAKRRELGEVEARLKVQQEELQRLEQEQGRLRENLQTAPGDSRFHSRMLEKLDAVENRIEGVLAQMEKLRKELENGKAALEKELLLMS